MNHFSASFSQEMQPRGAAPPGWRGSDTQTHEQGPGLRRIDPADTVRNSDCVQVPGQDVQQALCHPESVQDACQVCPQGTRAHPSRPRSQGEFYLQGELIDV